MPGMNGTGPLGQGPMTGGQRGVCTPKEGQEVDQSRFAVVRGRRRGQGARFQGRFGAGSGGRNRAGQGRR